MAVVVVVFAAEGFFGVVVAVDVGDFGEATGFFATGFTAGAWEDCIGVASAGGTLSAKVAASSNGPLAIASFRILSKQRLWFWISLIMCEALCVMLQIQSTGTLSPATNSRRDRTGQGGTRGKKGKIMDLQMRSVKIAFRFDEGRLSIRFARNY